TLALTLAAAVLYAIANSVPMLGLSIVGRHTSTTVLGGARDLWEGGQQIVAALVLITAVIAPALQIGFTLAIRSAATADIRADGWGISSGICRPPRSGA